MPEENKGTNKISSFFHNMFHKYDDEDDAEYDEYDDEDITEVTAEKPENAEKPETPPTEPVAAAKAEQPEKTEHVTVKVHKAEAAVSAPEPRKTETAAPRPAQPAGDMGKPSPTAGKLGSIFGKFVEIITQPDDSEFFEADEDMDEILSSAGESEEDKKRTAAASSLYTEKPAPAAVPLPVRKTEKPEADKQETRKPETVTPAPVKEIAPPEEKAAAADNSPAEEGESQPQSVKKAEITLDEIMQVRQTDVQRTPMTFRMPSAEVAAEEKETSLPVSEDTASTAEEIKDEEKHTEKTVRVRPVPISGKKEQKPVVRVQKVALKAAPAETEEPRLDTAEDKPLSEQTHTELFSAKKEETPPAEQTHTELFTAKKEETPPAEQTHTELFSAKKEETPPAEQTHTELFTAKKEETPPAEQTHTELFSAKKEEKSGEEQKAPAAVHTEPEKEVKPDDVPKAAAPAVKPTPVPVPVPAVKPAPVPVPVPTAKPAPVPVPAAKPAPVPVPAAKPAPAAPPPQRSAAVPAATARTSQSVFDEIKTARRAPEPAKRPEITQTDSEPIVYHGSEGIPFVVMAGKFSKTIRAQYEISRKYYSSGAARPVQPAPAVRPEAVEAPKAGTQPAPAETPQAAEPAAIPKPKIKKKPPIKMPKKKKSLGASISGLFSGEDEFDEDPDAEEAPRQELDDYRSSDEADEIKSDINDNLRNVFIRTVVLTATSVAAIITALLGYFMPWLFTTAIHHGWLVYALVNLLLLGISVYFDRYPIYSGLMSLLHFKGDSDTAGAVAVIAVTIQTIFALFLPDVFVNGTYHIYVPLVIFALLLSSLGKLLIIKRTADNFRFLLRQDSVYAGKIYKDMDKAEEFVKGLPSRKPIIAYIKKSAFMSNFLHLSYSADPVEELCRVIAPFTSYFALLCGIGYTAVTRDVVGGVSCFALSAVILIPMCGLLALNIPMKNLSGSTLKKGAMLAGYESVKQFADTNTVMLDYTQLYPKGSIILSGIKAFNENKIQEAILAGAAVTFSVDGSMSYIFENMIQDRRNMLPKVDSVSYDDNMGLSGWVEGRRRVLIGNRSLLEYHNITPPDEKLEAKYRKMGNEIAYITLGGELVAMFILTYKADRKIAEALREMEENGVSFLVRTIDPNITSKHIAEKFSLYGRCVKVLPTGQGTVCYDEISGKEKSSRAYLVTNGSIEAFAAAITGCIKMRSAVTISKIIQMLSIGIGFVLVNVIAFLSGFAKLGCFELLLYISFWCIALIAVSVIARKIS